MIGRLGPAFQVLKTALAAGLSWELATLVSQSQYPYFAPLAVILTLQATVADTVQKALFRVAGMVGGVVVSLLVLVWLPVGAVAISLTLLAGMAISALLRLNPQITSQVGVTALLVLISHDTRHYARDRVLETALGAVVAIVVNALVIPPDLTPLAEQRVAGLTELLAQSLRDLSGGPSAAHEGTLPRGKAVETSTTLARDALESARQSIKYNPFLGRRGARLAHLAQVMPNLEKMAIQVRGILRGVHDLGEPTVAEQVGLFAVLHDTAACVAALSRVLVAPAPESRSLLNTALGQARARHSRCLRALHQLGQLSALPELGAILTDVNRILSEVGAAAGEQPAR